MQMHKNDGDDRPTARNRPAPPISQIAYLGNSPQPSGECLIAKVCGNFAVEVGVCEGQALHFFKGNLSETAVEKMKFIV